jgi:hypothetical protein
LRGGYFGKSEVRIEPAIRHLRLCPHLRLDCWNEMLFRENRHGTIRDTLLGNSFRVGSEPVLA